MSRVGFLLLLGVEAVLSQNPRIPAMDHLRNPETFKAEKLGASEKGEIWRELGKGSFDAPDSWEDEVRVRRISLGAADGLVVQGVRLLCGATGNCQTWVFRRLMGHWSSLFAGQAPLASGFGFDEPASHGIKRLVISSNASAEAGEYRVYEFDGRFYRAAQCYQASKSGTNGTKQLMKPIPCQ
jgi:hypothetical protein